MSPFLSDTLLRTQSDERLAALAAAGRDRAFEVLVERHRRSLLTFARHAVGTGRAEDVVQQALLQAWRSLQAGAEVQHVRGWLHQIVRHAAWRTAREAGDAQLPAGLVGSLGPQDEVEKRMEVSAVVASLAAMPENQRAAIVQTVLEGQSQREVAKSLGLTEGAVRQLVHRGRSFLRAAATAVVPMPLAQWAANASGGSGSPVTDRIAEGVAGAGSAGAVGLLAKGGVAVVAAGAVATGIAAQDRPPHRPPPARVATAAVARPSPRAPSREEVVLPASSTAGGNGAEVHLVAVHGSGSGSVRPHHSRNGTSGDRQRSGRGYEGSSHGSGGGRQESSGNGSSSSDSSTGSGRTPTRSSDDSSHHDGSSHSGSGSSGSSSDSSSSGSSDSSRHGSGDGSGDSVTQTVTAPTGTGPPPDGSGEGSDSAKPGDSGKSPGDGGLSGLSKDSSTPPPESTPSP